MLVQNRSHYVTVHLRYNNEMCCTKRSLPMLHYVSVRPWRCNVMRLLSASAFYIVLTPHGLFMKPNLVLSVFLLSYAMVTLNFTLWDTFIIFESQNELYFGQALNHNSLNGKEWIRYILMFICRIYQKPSLGRYWVVNKCFHNIMYLHGWPHLLFNFDKRKGNRK